MHYNIEVSDEYVIVRGASPIGHMQTITKLAPENAVMAIDLYDRYGATLICASREGVARLRADAPKRPIPMALLSHSDAAKRWWAEGVHGTSARAMFEAQLDIQIDRVKRRDHPRDLDDFQRCVRMAEMVPEAHAGELSRVSDLSPEWRAITDNWFSIIAAMDAEAPDWRKSHGCDGLGNATSATILLRNAIARGSNY